MGARAPVGYGCQWLSGAPDIFKIKIRGVGGGISNHCLKLLLQPSPACGISPHPPTAPGADRPSLSYAHTPECSPKYTRALTKSHLSRCCRGGKSLRVGSEPSCLEERDVGGDWRRAPQVARAASGSRRACPPLTLLLQKDFFCLRPFWPESARRSPDG